jgi:hypothetical protein
LRLRLDLSAFVARFFVDFSLFVATDCLARLGFASAVVANASKAIATTSERITWNREHS